MVNGVLYTTAGTRRAVVALDAATGEMLWMHSVDEGKRGEAAPRQLSGRGLAYWTDGRDERIVYVTPGYQLVALDAKTGQRVASFGKDGIVDLKLELDQEDRSDHRRDRPARRADHREGRHRHRRRASRRRRAEQQDQRQGLHPRLRRAHRQAAVDLPHHPAPGRVRQRHVGTDSWSYTGNAGVWAQMSADEELGLVYLPVELPTGDYYGGHRPAARRNLFGESLVALDLKTGKRKWHYQLVHHGIWDMDIPCAPILDGPHRRRQPVKAVAQPTKQGWLYVFDRATGQPVWPIEERPVEKGDVPGEWYSPTQPFVDQAAGVRAPGRVDRRSDRLHAGAARRSA